MLNRREYPRMLERSQVAVTLLPDPDAPPTRKETIFCATEDVSVGGVKLRSLQTFSAGRRVQLLVAFSSPRRSFRHVGRVTRVGEREADGHCTMGIEFTETPDAVLAQWREVVDGKLRG
jgi:hypothetical protein